MSKSSRICLGIDNGHYAHKVWDHAGKMSSVLTRTRRGEHNSISMMAGGKTTTVTLLADGMPFTCGETLRTFEPVKPLSFPTSQLARVLLHYALHSHEGGRYRGASEVEVCTGLPLGRYLLEGTNKVDNTLIESVQQNLSKPVILQTKDDRGNTVESEVALKVIVKPQTFVAWYAYVFEEQRKDADPTKPKIIQHQSRMHEPTAIIDIGGGTTEICVIENMEMDCAVSGSKYVGSNNVRDKLSEMIRHQYSMDSMTSYMLDRAMTEKQIELDGHIMNVHSLYDEALRISSEEIVNFIDDKIGRRQREINAVRLIGGGCGDFMAAIEKSVSRIKMVENPQYENAKGMYYMLRYLMRG